jgi:fucose permease
MACALVLVTGALVALDVIRKRGEGWGVALFVLGVGGAFLWFLVGLLREQAAMNAALAARDLDLPSPHPFDDGR